MAAEYFVVPVDLQRCGRPDTLPPPPPPTLSRSNLIGTPQRLRALPTIGQCVYTVYGDPLPFPYDSLIRVFLEQRHVAARGRKGRILGLGRGGREEEIYRKRESGSQQTMLLLDKVLFSVVVFACNQPHPPPPGLHYLLVLFVVVSCNLHVPRNNVLLPNRIFYQRVMDFASGIIDRIRFGVLGDDWEELFQRGVD